MIPKVSVIITTYNREKFICDAISSVRKQSFSDMEIIVIDDASEDNTEEVVKKCSLPDKPITYIRNSRNLGMAKTRNIGLRAARGIYIAPLDSDDIWIDQDKIKNQVEFLDTNTDYALIGGGILYIDKDSKPLKKILYPIYDSVIRNIILQYNPFTHSTVLFRKALALEVGGYNEDYKTCEDYDLWLKMGLKHKFTNIPKILSGYRVHGGNVTRNKRLTVSAISLEIVKKYVKYYRRPYIGITKAYLRVLVSYMRS